MPDPNVPPDPPFTDWLEIQGRFFMYPANAADECTLEESGLKSFPMEPVTPSPEGETP